MLVPEERRRFIDKTEMKREDHPEQGEGGPGIYSFKRQILRSQAQAFI